MRVLRSKPVGVLFVVRSSRGETSTCTNATTGTTSCGTCWVGTSSRCVTTSAWTTPWTAQTTSTCTSAMTVPTRSGTLMRTKKPSAASTTTDAWTCPSTRGVTSMCTTATSKRINSLPLVSAQEQEVQSRSQRPKIQGTRGDVEQGLYHGPPP